MSILDLFKPPHRRGDPEARLRAVRKITDEDLLAAIAREDPSPRVRAAAVEGITGEEILASIARDAPEIDARIAAVQKISSQEVLAGIIKSRRNLELMGACFARITDREILASIARDPGYNIAARRIAFENFADESFLSDVAEELNPRTGESKAKSEEEIEAMLAHYGGARVVRAIGRFRGSEKAIGALGTIARKGGECGELAVEYLARGLVYSNPAVRRRAEEELSRLGDPELVGAIIRQMDNPALRTPIERILRAIGTPQARAALGRDGAAEEGEMGP